jgi:phosphosulfolactate synthase (CoM biosynthesis protein A)
MEPEDFDQEFAFDEQELIDQLIREKEKQFSEGCQEGYLLIQEHGKKALDLSDKESAQEACRRMLGYFIQVEEYEKCSVIQKVYNQAFKKVISPIFPTF